MTRILWGYEASNAHSSGRTPIYTDFSKVVNPHMMVCGDSGTGKTHTLRHAISEVCNSSQTPVRFHIFDVHGDITMDNRQCSEVVFSGVSPFGLNPLKINPDPHFGGVRKAVQGFINILRLSPTTSRSLGPKQQDVLRNLMMDVFEFSGFHPDDPSTWIVADEPPPSNLVPNRAYIDIPFAEKDLAKKLAESSGINISFDVNNKCWHASVYDGPLTRWPLKQWGRTNPTLSTLVQYATRRREMSFTGLGQKEAALLEVVHRKSRSLSRVLQQHTKTHNNGTGIDESERATEDLEKAKTEALKGFSDYFAVLEHGTALEALLKYDSHDSLSTVKQILDSLNASGIFRDQPPNFDPRKPVWRYNLKAVGQENQKFMINVRLRDIFDRAVQRGESDVLREVIVIDEGAKFVEKDDDHIINIIALEARKFGLGIWFASQSPTQYPESLLSTMATKVILGLDPNFWPLAQRQLRIEQTHMSWIRPRESMLVNLKLGGQSSQPWVRAVTPSKVAMGVA